MRKWFNVLALALCLWVYFPVATAEGIVATDVTLVKKIPQSLSNPRETMKTFIQAMSLVAEGDKSQIKQAVSTLDLSGLEGQIADIEGRKLVFTLASVIERSKKIVFNTIPLDPINDKYTFGHYSQGEVSIVKQADGRWLFSVSTIDALPAILEGLLDVPVTSEAENTQATLPFHTKLYFQMLEIKDAFLFKYWQWLGVFLVIIVGSIVDKLVGWFLARNVVRWKKHNPSFNTLDDTVLKPLGLMAMALIWWFGLNLLDLPNTASVILSVAVKLLVSLSGVWSTFRLVDVVDVLLTKKAKITNNRLNDLLVPMVSKILKVFIVLLGCIFIADNLDVDITSLLAGLGLGGLAFALAAKDLLGNFFGSLTVLLDRPFHLGDWVIIGDVEGSVEEVGFRSTRIRTFYNSLITLPNAILTNTKIDNMGARRYRRMKTMLNLTYQTTPEKIDAFCEGIRAFVQLHPYMRRDHYQVYFNGYNAASLDILVYVFWETPNWNTELRERHRFLLDILRLAKQLGVEFAYPTQTLYLKKDDGQAVNDTIQAFNPAMTELDAFAMGRREAEAIVDGTLGRDTKPEPVRFP